MKIIQILWALITWLPFGLLAPILNLIPRKKNGIWVISGHRGRIYADNAASLHAYIHKNTPTNIVWISSSASLTAELRQKGYTVVTKHSFKARWLILRSPVLIYSHGEDDLDLFNILLRPFLGLRIYLNHCMNHIKAGDYYRKDVEEFGWLRLKVFHWLITDFDYLLASSKLEKKHFELSLPHRKDQIILGGGAHIDEFMSRRGHESNGKVIWFPTWRDRISGQEQLEASIQTLCESPKIHQWLESEGLELQICNHINSLGQAAYTPSHPRIKRGFPDNLVDQIARSELFISDYSGLIADYLAMEKPAVFFPFDLDDYLQTRRIYIPYDKLHFGPLVFTVDDLIHTLKNNTWKDLDIAKHNRQELIEAVFPTLNPSYAKNGYKTINHLLN